MTPVSRRLAAGGLALGLSLAGAGLARAAWEPQRPIELILMAGEGDGAGRMAGFLREVVAKRRWSPRPLVLVRKPGGSGVEALIYLRQRHADPHVILLALNGLFSAPLLQKLPIGPKDLTPIYRLATEAFLLWVHADSPVRTLGDYVAAAKRAAGTWRMGLRGRLQEDELAAAMLEKAYGIKHSYVAYPGGAEAARELAEGRLDSAVGGPSEQLSWWRGGKSRPIVSFAAERLGMFPAVPTFGELGRKEVVYAAQRSIVAPAGIPGDARRWYVDLFEKLCDSPEWKRYAEGNALARACLSGEPLGAFFAEEAQKHRKLLAAMGLAK